MNILSFKEWCRFDEKQKRDKDLRKTDETNKEIIKKKLTDSKVTPNNP
jgi:hypothetical protein